MLLGIGHVGSSLGMRSPFPAADSLIFERTGDAGVRYDQQSSHVFQPRLGRKRPSKVEQRHDDVGCVIWRSMSCRELDLAFGDSHLPTLVSSYPNL